MDLVRSWVTAIVVYLVASLVTASAGIASGITDEDLDGGGLVTWNAVPSFITFVLVALLAAVAHPAPERRRPVRHVLAVAAVPVLMIVLGIALGVAQGEMSETAVSTAAAVVGTAAGWALSTLLLRWRSA